MTILINTLRTEADPELTDKKNEAIVELTAQNYGLYNCVATFHQPTDFCPLGVVEFKYGQDTVLKAFYTVYIQEGIVRASLVTLDMIRLIDAKFNNFLQELKSFSLIKDTSETMLFN